MTHDDTSFDSIFSGAIELASPEERAAFIARACGPDEELRRRVERLVDAHFQAGSFLESPRASPTVSIDTSRSTEVSGTVIGPYKLLQSIGEGGMGSVYMAEQTMPVRRLVALKVIKSGMDSRQVLARFGAERQALALMDHPNIAKVLDAGTTDGGRPYFVMELVKGVPITRFCDEHRLSTRERLELAIPVCQAVQHAHQKGVIHRDLKPSNILVALYDDKPVPKVIDFGVAKATGPRLTDQTLYTEFGSVVGTLEYMSPEQAQLNQLDIDTRSDVYSLGVLLYELLTGSTPLDRKRLTEAAFLEVLRVIREEESPRPSMRLETTEELPSIAACRGIDPRRLSGLMRGELDWIVMKALEKDRNRRYQTASELARDVEHYLHDEPVLACPPSVRYRLGKFVRRHWGPVLSASLVLLVLLGGVIGTSFGLLRAQEARRAEAKRAEGERLAKETAQRRLTQIEKANEILGSIFKDLDPDTAENEGKPLPALLGERLDQATAQLEGEVIGDPLAVARMQVILGESQLGLGDAQKAILLFIKARTTFTAQRGADHPDTLTSMNGLALGYQGAGKLDLALPLYEETLKRRKATLGPDHTDTLQSMNNLALGYGAAGKLDLALPLFEETLKLIKAKLGPDHANTLKIMNNLGMGYGTTGKLDLALPLFKETLERRKATLGPNHRDTLESMNNLALGYQDTGKLDLALPLYEETLKRRKATLGPNHTDTLQSMNNLAWGYQAAGKLDLALPLFEDTLKLIKPKLGPDHPNTLRIMNNLGKGYILVGQPAKAEPLLRECLAILEREPDAWRTFDTKSMLGAAPLGQKKYSEAEPLLVAGYQGLKQREATIPPPSKVRLIEALERLVQLYEATGNKDKAIEWRTELAKAVEKKSD